MKENSIHPCMIYIDKNGKWFHRGIEMIHKAIVNEFYRNLTIDSCGEYLIVRGSEKCFVEVEDTPFIITRVEFDDTGEAGEQQLILSLIDDTSENLDPETLSVGADNVLYCRIKNNSFKARFNRASYYQIASRIKEEGDKYYLPLNNSKYYIV
jgi:hypothetical protein